MGGRIVTFLCHNGQNLTNNSFFWDLSHKLLRWFTIWDPKLNPLNHVGFGFAGDAKTKPFKQIDLRTLHMFIESLSYNPTKFKLSLFLVPSALSSCGCGAVRTVQLPQQRLTGETGKIETNWSSPQAVSKTKSAVHLQHLECLKWQVASTDVYISKTNISQIVLKFTFASQTFYMFVVSDVEKIGCRKFKL